jgi:hypothetical protein
VERSGDRVGNPLLPQICADERRSSKVGRVIRGKKLFDLLIQKHLADRKEFYSPSEKLGTLPHKLS